MLMYSPICNVNGAIENREGGALNASGWHHSALTISITRPGQGGLHEIREEGYVA